MAVVIASFACRKTERLWQRRRDHGLPPQIERVALRKLTQLHRSRELSDLRIPPGNRLEVLKGGRAGQYSIRINDQWRICFRWHEGDAIDVKLSITIDL
jgi:proteic killer suppression protein